MGTPDRSDEKQAFRDMLIVATKFYTHAEIAAQLDMERWQVRNWMYRYLPNAWAVRQLKPKLTSIIRQAKRPRSSPHAPR